jgi:hypothetical protein
MITSGPSLALHSPFDRGFTRRDIALRSASLGLHSACTHSPHTPIGLACPLEGAAPKACVLSVMKIGGGYANL